MSGLAQSIVDAVSWLLDQIYVPFGWILDGLLYLLISIPWFIIDGFLSAVEIIIAGLDLSSVAFSWVAGYALVPDQAIYFMVAIGFPQFVTIIASAYAIRFALNIIPSVLTRV